MSSLLASIKWIGAKPTEKRWRHRSPHYKSIGAFWGHGNQSFDPICPQTLCSLSPTPVMLHIKFVQNWPTGFRDIQVESVHNGRTDDQTDGRPLVYYKLTLWAFGSGELKTEKTRTHLIWVYTVCWNLSVRKLMINTVLTSVICSMAYLARESTLSWDIPTNLT